MIANVFFIHRFNWKIMEEDRLEKKLRQNRERVRRYRARLSQNSRADFDIDQVQQLTIEPEDQLQSPIRDK